MVFNVRVQHTCRVCTMCAVSEAGPLAKNADFLIYKTAATNLHSMS